MEDSTIPITVKYIVVMVYQLHVYAFFAADKCIPPLKQWRTRVQNIKIEIDGWVKIIMWNLNSVATCKTAVLQRSSSYCTLDGYASIHFIPCTSCIRTDILSGAREYECYYRPNYTRWGVIGVCSWNDVCYMLPSDYSGTICITCKQNVSGTLEAIFLFVFHLLYAHDNTCKYCACLEKMEII